MEYSVIKLMWIHSYKHYIINEEKYAIGIYETILHILTSKSIDSYSLTYP